MSLNNVRAIGDDRPWKDEVEREIKGIWDSLKYGKISLRASTAGTTGGGGGGGGGGDLGAINATLPATYDTVTYTVGVDQDSFDHLSSLDYLDFNTATAAADAVGRMVWDANVGTLRLGLAGGVVEAHLGQAQYALVKNNTGTAFTKGQVVYPSGSVGASGVLEVSLAIATGDSTSAQTFGVVSEPIANGAQGYVQTYGVMENINTSTLTAGQVAFLSGSTAGGMTSTKPQAPTHLVYVGFCLRSQSSTGMIFIKPQNGYELDEIHDVKITGPIANNEVLAYTSATSLWENKTAAEASLLTTSATLDSLADVAITSPATDQYIKYNGTSWVNATFPTAGTGTVTNIATGTGLTGGPITTTGTISLANTAVSAASYGSASAVGTFTVDAQGRLTAASSTSIAIAGSQITSGTVAIANGGTAASTADTARANLSAVGVFTQGTEPAGGNIGDIWIDTDSGQNVIGAVPRFEATRVGTQSIPDGSSQVISYTAIVENVGGFVHSAGTVTVPLTGRYSLASSTTWSNAGNGRRTIRFNRNTNTFWTSRIQPDNQAGGIGQVIAIPSYRLNAGDNITVEVVQGNGSTLTISDSIIILEYLGA